MMTSTSALTRSYSCHGKIQEKCCSSKKSSVLLNNLINAQNLIMSEDLMVEQQPRIIILQGRKIVRKKKRQCVKCKFILSFFPYLLPILRGNNILMFKKSSVLEILVWLYFSIIRYFIGDSLTEEYAPLSI